MIHIDTVTPEDINSILKLYQAICGGSVRYINAEDVIRTLKSDDRHDRFVIQDGYRIGSKWSMNSKIRFSVKDGRVLAIMDENLDHSQYTSDNPVFKEATEASVKFVEAVCAL